jgi:hypothetical protein
MTLFHCASRRVFLWQEIFRLSAQSAGARHSLTSKINQLKDSKRQLEAHARQVEAQLEAARAQNLARHNDQAAPDPSPPSFHDAEFSETLLAITSDMPHCRGALDALGLTTCADVGFLEISDFEERGLTRLQARKLLKRAKQHVSHLAFSFV